jgi:hypothetical protein
MKLSTSVSRLAVCLAAVFFQRSASAQGLPPPIEISVRVPEPVTGEPGSTVQFDAFLTISVGCDACEPFAGQTLGRWDIVVAAEGCTMLSASWTGTQVDPNPGVGIFQNCTHPSRELIGTFAAYISRVSPIVAPGLYTVLKIRCAVTIPSDGSCAPFSFRLPQAPLRHCPESDPWPAAADLFWWSDSVTESFPPDQPLTFADSTAEACPPAAPGGLQLPSDCNQDGILDLSDAICLLGHLFLGAPATLPCEGGTAGDPGNLALLDANGDTSVDLSDPILVLSYLFSGTAAPVHGSACLPIEGCPELSGACGG